METTTTTTTNVAIGEKINRIIEVATALNDGMQLEEDRPKKFEEIIGVEIAYEAERRRYTANVIFRDTTTTWRPWIGLGSSGYGSVDAAIHNLFVIVLVRAHRVMADADTKREIEQTRVNVLRDAAKTLTNTIDTDLLAKG